MERPTKTFCPDRVLSYFRVEWLPLTLVTVSGLVYNIGLLATPWFEGRLAQCLADILGGSETAARMALLVLAYILTILVVQAARFVKRFYVRRFANNINRRMKGILYANLVRQSRTALEQEGAGDHDDVKTYQKLHADTAAMLVVMDTDIRSTNIVFSAREAAPQVVIAAGVENPDATDILRLAGCNRVFQFHNVLGEAMARRVVRSSQRASIMGRFGRLVVAEAPVMHSSLAGKTLLDCSLRERTGINVVGVWDRGAFQLPGPHTMFTESSVLVVAGTEKQVRTFDRLISEPEKAEMENVPVVILGGGRVGLAVARNLARRKIPAVIVDRQPHINSGAIPHVHGDAADLAVLEKAGIRKTRTIIITTHDDDANIYLTIYSRRLRPDAQILCRASLDRNVNGLHSAGADQVLSLASLVSNSIINLLAPDKMMMLNERLLVFRYTIRGQLQGKSLMECGIRNKTKCSVLAVRDNTGTMHVNPDPGYIFALGDALYLIGDSEAEERFRERYGIDSNLACADADLS